MVDGKAPADIGGDDPSGARRLAAAVIVRAGIDLQSLAKALASPKGKPKARELDALAWLLDADTAAPWSLRWCCELLDCAADNIRGRAVAMVDREKLRVRLIERKSDRPTD
jgi:hypothetical protein